MNNETDCQICHRLLERIDVKLEIQNKNFMKIFFAMLGIIGTQVGVKFLGTPWYLYIGVYASLFSGIFLCCMSIYQRHVLNHWQKMVRVCFLLMLFYGSILRIIFYNLGERIPPQFGIGSNLLYVILSVGLVLAAWNHKDNPPIK